MCRFMSFDLLIVCAVWVTGLMFTLTFYVVKYDIASVRATVLPLHAPFSFDAFDECQGV